MPLALSCPHCTVDPASTTEEFRAHVRIVHPNTQRETRPDAVITDQREAQSRG